GTPTAIMEAMSMGRPCIVTDAPGCREVVEDGKNGLLVPLKNPATLAEAMERLCAHPELLGPMGVCGREMATSRFDANLVAKSILDNMHVPDQA
ncbi:MAG: glycosyltransferase, partial [Candidatus Desulfovibrio faecigallinarum]|nr:glycosyltransferase [Candidatus Desulfovibrio faecigallinarum]